MSFLLFYFSVSIRTATTGMKTPLRTESTPPRTETISKTKEKDIEKVSAILRRLIKLFKLFIYLLNIQVYKIVLIL